MNNQQFTKTASNQKYNKTTLAKAGQLSLSSTYSPHRLLQEVGNDEEFLPLTNVTTAYMDQQGNIVDLPSRIKQVELQSQKKVNRNGNSLPHAKLEVGYQYAKIASSFKNSTKPIYESKVQKKKDKQKLFLMKNEQELTEIQHIISEIKEVVNASLGQSIKSPFKMETKLVHHSQKRNWQTKGVNHFGKNNSISKLEEMLLNYNFNDQNLVNKKEDTQLLPPKETKNRQRKERNRKYRQLQIQLKQPQANEQKSQLKPIQAVSKENNQGLDLNLQDIQIVEFQWNKLPIIASPLYMDNYDLFIRMREFPENYSFIEAINQVFRGQKQYKTYSIFNPSLAAGIIDDNLLSQEEYRQQWASQWQFEVQEQQTKDLLCQFDFQWYRALVQISYSHSLEQLLVKKIKYDIQIYKQNLRKINGTFNDKNKLTDNLEVGLRILYNKLKYAEIILNKFYEEHLKKHQKQKAVIVGVVPSLGQEFEEKESKFVRNEVQNMFVGGLYAAQNNISMAVMIPLKQAKQNKIERKSSALVKLGKVSLMINQDEKNEKAPKIVLIREKLKNSLIKIEILREKQQAVLLQVGQELHFGRRYHIEID